MIQVEYGGVVFRFKKHQVCEQFAIVWGLVRDQVWSFLDAAHCCRLLRQAAYDDEQAEYHYVKCTARRYATRVTCIFEVKHTNKFEALRNCCYAFQKEYDRWIIRGSIVTYDDYVAWRRSVAELAGYEVPQ